MLGELGLGPRTIAVAPVGCAVFAYDYLGLDFVEAPHGRAPAVATGIRRVRPDAFVLTYQGDGDLAAIGTAEIVHAAARGELLTAVFVNNGIYGMTGGQMAPTTLLGQRSTSSPTGRDAAFHGYPIPMTEMLAVLPGVAYAARGSVADAVSIGRTKRYLQRACEMQLEGRGFSIVEVISNCPVGWGMTPEESIERLKEVVALQYKPGVIVDRTRDSPPGTSVSGAPTPDADCGAGRGALTVERSIIIAGFGGQGILFAGKVLARAAMNEDREVLWIPSYGPEMRGGTASCTVIVGDEPIGSPVVDLADAAVVLNPPSHAKFATKVAPGGLLVVNETLVGEHVRPDGHHRAADPLHAPCPGRRRRLPGQRRRPRGARRVSRPRPADGDPQRDPGDGRHEAPRGPRRRPGGVRRRAPRRRAEPAASRPGGDPGLSLDAGTTNAAAGAARVSRRCARGGEPRDSRGPAAPPRA